MKYYKLIKDLPTFNKGELFYLNDYGELISFKHRNVVVYSSFTFKEFPNILKDWFKEVPDPERDRKTKYAFMEYLRGHKEERFFQAVRNFAREYLGENFSFIYASKKPHEDYIKHYEGFKDTFYIECDRLHELEEKNDTHE